jgi:pimeloyl-ACP methyl ester carboxylesterase
MRHFETVIAKDGTAIACARRGHGPPLVMVHGSASDHSRWGGIVAGLAEHFTLWMVDRRGRGRSGDGPSYAIEREFEDVAAVLEATPSPARVLAHSYGAICSLEAARLTGRIVGMVLYEPPFRVPDAPLGFPAELPERLAALLAQGDRDGVIATFFREALHMGPAEIERLRQAASWPVRLDAAVSLPREVAAAVSYRFRPEHFREVRVPMLFLHGDRSPVQMQASTRLAAAAVAGSRIEVLGGHAHGAMTSGPKVFLEVVLPFLCRSLV